jgi:hypothetical protein
MLLYTGIRKSEGLDLLSANVRPDDQAAWVQTSKNEDPRMLKLREDIVTPLRLHLEKAGDHLFRFHDGGYFKHYLTRARMAASGLPCPKRRPNKWREPPTQAEVCDLLYLPTHVRDLVLLLRQRRQHRPGRHAELARRKIHPALSSRCQAHGAGSRGKHARRGE